MPAAYLFDMDGLLLDTERLTLAAFLDCADAFGLDPAEARAFFMTLVGVSAERSNDMLRRFLGPDRDQVGLQQLWRDRCRARLADEVPVKATVRETLQELGEQSARMAVVTSSHGAEARHHLRRAGLLTHFQFVLGGDEVARTKPDPAPYLEAAARLSLPAQECAAFEDSDFGITAASTAGCCAVQIPDLRAAQAAFPQVGQLFASTLKEAVATAQARFRHARAATAVDNLT